MSPIPAIWPRGARRSPLLALALLAAGCTSSGYAPLNDPHGLVATDGIILLDDEHGETLPVTPDSIVTFETDDGWTEPVRAGRLCRSAVDFSVRTGGDCDGAFRLAPYDAIRGVHVETADGAATVAIAGVVSAVALAALAALSAISPFKGSKSSSSSSSSASSTATPTLKYPPAHGHGASGSYAHYGSALPEAAEVLANVGLHAVASGLVPSGSYGAPEEPPPVPIEGPSFTPREVRRADLSVLASVDGTASLFGRDGLSTGAHVGVRVADFVDIGIGGRWLDGGTSLAGNRVVPTVVIGLHGEFPRARWVALGLSFEGGHGNDVNTYLDARLGVRFEPIRGLWIGVYPMHPSYIEWSGGRGSRWIPQSSADLAFGF